MPYLSELSPDTQNLILLSFEFFGKKFLLGIAITISLLYVFYWHKKHEKTPYLFVGILRSMFYMISIVVISTFPIMIFVLYPQVSMELLLKWMLLFYITGIFVTGAIIFLNIIYWSGVVLVRLGGFEADKKVNKVIDKTLNSVLIGLGLRKIKLPKVWQDTKYER